MKPEGYPLPWCEQLDVPYWRINFILCMDREGWREMQTGMSMREIIPLIDKELETVGPAAIQPRKEPR